MFCYLIRHGKDDDSVRGGWSDNPLTDEGVMRTKDLANYFAKNIKVNKIYSSDLTRARQTAQLIANKIKINIDYVPDFREVNNGDLANLKNDIADEKYPKFYWRKMEWNQSYPNGESPKEFYIRIKNAWDKFSHDVIMNNENIILVTHGGVIDVICNLVNGTEYTNKTHSFKLKNSDFIRLEYSNNQWKVN